MVFFNYATMQMAAKIVYYGPGLCGKTTNLRFIYDKTSPQSRGEMVSLETETDRTLFFDLLPLDVGVIGGFKTRLQLYTVPGQVFYNTTRKLVLKGVDGIVFVADSQKAMLDANVDSLANLRENLSEIGLNLDDIPLVLQLNKRDLPNVAERDAMIAALDPGGIYDAVEASAMTGQGVFETLKQISKHTLRTLRRRMMGEEPSRAASGPTSKFIVQDGTKGRAAAAAGQPAAPPAPAARASEPAAPHAAAQNEPVLTEVRAEEPFEMPVSGPTAQEERLAMADLDTEIITSTPTPVPESEPEPDLLTELMPEPEPVASEPPSAPEPQPEMKRLKVRSSIDIMSELEQLRKRATGTAAVRKKEPPHRGAPPSLHLPLSADSLGRGRRLRVSMTVEDAEGNVVQQTERSVEVDEPSDLGSVSLGLEKPAAD